MWSTWRRLGPAALTSAAAAVVALPAASSTPLAPPKRQVPCGVRAVSSRSVGAVRAQDVASVADPLAASPHRNQDRSAAVEQQLRRIAELAAVSGDEADLLKSLHSLEDAWWERGKLHRVVLTGGPCAGKSTVMTDLVQLLKERNYLVFTMPEIATEMFNWSGGRMWEDFGVAGSPDQRTRAQLQVHLTKVQMVIEDSIEMMARRSLAVRRLGPNPPVGAVILLDRGVVDNIAYCTSEGWAIVMEELGTTTARLRDRRYDHVIHLVTAANGAEQYYSLVQAETEEGQASARTETAEEARALCARTQAAWQGAKSHHIVTNAGQTFAEKREKVKKLVMQLVGDKSGKVKVGQRFVCEYLPSHRIGQLADADPDIPWNLQMRITMTKIGRDTRLQKREMGDQAFSYYHQALGEDGEVERQWQIDAWTYQQRLREARDGHQAVLAALGPPGTPPALKAVAKEMVQELKEEVVIFSYRDTFLRCHCFHTAEGEPMLVVDMNEQADSADEKLPQWLRTQAKAESFYKYSPLLA